MLSNIDLPIESSYSINTKIERELLYSITSSLPMNSNVVEVGTALGGTACLMSHSNPTINIHCIDSFKDNIGYQFHWHDKKYNYKDPALNEILDLSFQQDPSGLSSFRILTEKFKNIKLHLGNSPTDFIDWNIPLDLYLEDATHQNPILQDNINFWTQHLKPGGYIVGHDYGIQFPDVISEFNNLIVNGYNLVAKLDTMIVLQKPI